MKRIFILVFFIISGYIFSQEKDTIIQDVKIGLVLSGGGAKGFAHVGVLKVLEEQGIRIDYIAGTSMGAIIGGLYASGYNAKELDSVLKGYDLSGLVQDNLPRKSYSFYQKENDGKYAISLPVKKRKIELPSAVSKGQSVFNVFSQLTEHVHHVDDFSELAIPFFCIATDLETGEEIVLDKGFLPEAIRASGSFPGLLSPVKMGDRILVDGGIVNNFPVEKMREKGVDYIIGVNVAGGLSKREDLNTLPKILIQIAGYQMYNEWDHEISLTDIYLRPDIKDFNTFSFDRSDEIVIIGEEIAKEHLEEFHDIVKRQKRFKKNHTIKNFKIKDEIIIKEIKVYGNKHYTDNYCIKKLNLSIGDSISHKKFIQGINALTATGNFESINYKLVSVEGGSRVEFEIIENEFSTFIQFGAHYDNLYKTGVLVNLTKKHPLFKNDFLSFDLVIGDNIRYNLDYILDNGFNWSFGVNTRHNSFQEDLFIGENPQFNRSTSGLKIPIKYSDYTSQVYIQTTIRNKLAFRVGFEDKYLKAFTEEIRNDHIEKIYLDKSNYFNLFSKVKYDAYTSSYFPKKGLYIDANYFFYLLSSDYLNTFDSFSQVYGRLGYAYTFFDKLTLHYISEAGITIGVNGNTIHDYHLGGNNQNFVNTFVPFYGYDVAGLNDSNYLKSALTVRYEIFKNNFVSFTGNYARLEKDIWNGGSIFADTRSGYAFGYGLQSIIGPIELHYSWTPDTKQIFWYINVGFWF